jgi:hypothetical protein
MTPKRRRGVAIGLLADRCSNQISYSGDLRLNAEINSIDVATGQCPAPVGGTYRFPI